MYVYKYFSLSQTDLEAALAAKNAVLEQLRREMRDLQAKLEDAEEKILHLTTSKAAELASDVHIHWKVFCCLECV